MRKNQKGFTIVELLIAITILSIVIAAVGGFIVVGSRSYAAGNSDINVQQEAQLALNQMSDVLIDTTRSVNYVGYDASGSPEHALKDAEFTFTPEDKSLVMYNGVVEETAPAVPGGTPTKTVDPGNGNKHYHFYWSKNDETLYYAQLDVDPGDVDTAGIHFPVFDPADPIGAGWVVLAGHVTDFSVDLSQVEEKRVVQLALTFVDGRKEYVTSNNVTIRNKVGVNDAELSPLNKRKTLSVAARDSGVIIEPGETFHFSTPKVTGENVSDRSVVWSLASAGGSSPSGGTAFTDTANGILKVATDEPAGTIDVVITTNAVDSDGNHASCSLTVYIKRVTAVGVAKTADSDTDNGAYEISPGCTFTISADVTGVKLGEVCSACNSPDIDIDKVVGNNANGTIYPWLIHDPPGSAWNPNDWIDIIESEPDHATFRLKANAPTSDPNTGVQYTAVIQCMSLLSVTDNTQGRHYDNWVPGAITLTFKKTKKNIQVNGNLQWGVKSTIMHEIDYPDDFNRTGQGYYLICARVREDGTEGGDKIMIYRTTGNTSEVTPDMFGVEDISKPWYLSLQVLDPGQHIQQGVGPSEELFRDLEQQIHDPLVKDVVAEYLANCDASGTYVGTKYPHTDKFEGRILPPEIFYSYNGQTNLGGELHLKPVSTLAGPEWTNFSVDYVKNTRDERDGHEFTNTHVKLSVYKEKSGGGLEPIYVYKQQNGTHYSDATKEGPYEGNQRPYNGALYFDVGHGRATNAGVQLDFNRKEMFSQAAGKYRIVPTIQYHNNPSADTSYTIYYANYQPWYWHMRVYEVPESTIYYELTNGGNLELWSYYNNQFTKGEIYFPTPSDLSQWWASPSNFDYYFNISDLQGDLAWHEAKQMNNFQKIVDGSGGNQIYYQPSSMRCRYVKDKNVYQLELFYIYWDSVWNMNVEVSAGVFQCAADGTRWEKITKGTYDSQLESGNMKPQLNPTANVNFWVDGRQCNGKMYIPLPSEKAFTSTDNNGLGFALKQGAEQSRDWRKLRYQPTGQTNTQEVGFARVICAYNSTTDTYTLKMYDQNGNNVATFTCKSNGKQWTQQ